MSTIPGGKVVTHSRPDQKRAPSPHDRDNPQAAAKQVDNAEARQSKMKAHRESLSEPRTDR
jgi:hypothetical protein